jgi:hypothetical protein
LTRDQEAALYRHYGIEYSADTSDSLLPAGVEPTDPENTGSESGMAAGQHVASDAGRRGGAVAAAVAALVGLTAAVVAVLRLRRRTPPPPPAARRVLAVRTAAGDRAMQVAAAAGPVVEASGRLARSGASAGAAAVRRAVVDATQRSRAATTAAKTYTDVTAARLVPLMATTGQAAWRGVRAGTDSALRVTDAATEAVMTAVPRVTASTVRAGRTGLRAVRTVGAAAEAVPEAVAETGERLEKGWKKVMSRLSLGLGLGVGYVLGARAGRARFEQIKQAAAGYLARPEVQQTLEKARAAAPAPLRSGIDMVSGRGSGSQGADAETIDVGADLVDEPNVVMTPPPPVSGTGGPSGTDAALRDPLIPPATSADGPTARP